MGKQSHAKRKKTRRLCVRRPLADPHLLHGTKEVKLEDPSLVSCLGHAVLCGDVESRALRIRERITAQGKREKEGMPQVMSTRTGRARARSRARPRPSPMATRTRGLCGTLSAAIPTRACASASVVTAGLVSLPASGGREAAHRTVAAWYTPNAQTKSTQAQIRSVSS